MSTRTYTATEQVYLSKEGQMVYPGEKFTVDTATPTASTWLDEDGEAIPERKRVPKPPRAAGAQANAAIASPAGSVSVEALVEALRAAAPAPVDYKELAEVLRTAAPAAAPAEPVDLYGKLSIDELKALAGVRKIAITGKSEAEIAAALRASDAEG